MRAARSALWLTAGALLAAPLPAFFSYPIPVPITAALATVALLAAWRTLDAVLVLAALAPLAGAIHALSGAPYDPAALLEAFVLAALAGAAVRAAARGAALPSSAFELCVLGLAALALASCVALVPMATLRGGVEAWPRAVGTLIASDYFVHHSMFVPVERTAPLLEGCALAILTAGAVRGRDDALRLSAMVVAGGTAAATLNVYRLLEIALRRPSFLDAVIDALRSVRFNTQFADLNAAGSYFALVTILAASHAGLHTTRARLHLAALPLLGCALWVTGSRVALAATFLSLVAAVLARRYGGALLRVRMSRAAVLSGAAVVLALFGALVFLLPVTRHGSFQYSLGTRVGLAESGFRMVADRPLLGVGISQYYALFPQYADPELLQMFEQELGYAVTHENAHNQFLQLFAELGLAGLAAFLALLAFGLRRGGSAGHWRGAAVAAIGGFLLTALAGHPLLTPMVSASFWMVLGLAAAGAPPAGPRTRRILAGALTTAAVLLVVSVPWRWRVERHDADLANVSVGLSRWHSDESGRRFQNAAGRAALFVGREAAVVRIPLRSGDGAARRVEILLDGRLAGVAHVGPDEWREVNVPFTDVEGRPRYRRIDLVPEAAEADAAGRSALLVGRMIEVPR